MAINPVRFNPMEFPANPTPVPLNFSALADIGSQIGLYRRQQDAANIIARNRDESGNFDIDKAAADLAAGGHQEYANQLLAAGARRQALTQSAAGQAETGRHNRATEEALRTGKIPFGWEIGPDGTPFPSPGGPHDPAYLNKLAELKGEKPPSGYRYRTDQPGVLEAIPGGPGEKIASETAARVGLTKSFLDEINDTTDAQGNLKPGLRSRITSGEMTGGIFNPAMAWAGLGTQAEVRRKVDSGADALLRALTGAGMNLTEAQDYTRRYRFSPRDTVGQSLSKLDQLERELKYTMTEVTRGHGGPTPGAGRPTPAAPGGGIPAPPPGFIMR